MILSANVTQMKTRARAKN